MFINRSLHLPPKIPSVRSLVRRNGFSASNGFLVPKLPFERISPLYRLTAAFIALPSLADSLATLRLTLTQTLTQIALFAGRREFLRSHSSVARLRCTSSQPLSATSS